MSRQKALDADLKAIHQKRIHWTIKDDNLDSTNVVNESMVLLVILKKKVKKKTTKVFSKECNSIIKDIEL